MRFLSISATLVYVSGTVNGMITVKDGKVAYLKNVTDLNAANVASGDLHIVLQTLAKAGWKLQGDYDLVISKLAD